MSLEFIQYPLAATKRIICSVAKDLDQFAFGKGLPIKLEDPARELPTKLKDPARELPTKLEDPARGLPIASCH
jgi:hypothetical protein